MHGCFAGTCVGPVLSGPPELAVRHAVFFIANQVTSQLRAMEVGTGVVRRSDNLNSCGIHHIAGAALCEAWKNHCPEMCFLTLAACILL